MGVRRDDGSVVRGWERDFVDHVAARAGGLRRTPYLLCGSWHQAEDLAQATLTRLFLSWHRIDRDGSVDGYARRRPRVDRRRTEP
jgi:DNA-directed RNA polymerase specialized sigma24 family protein